MTLGRCDWETGRAGRSRLTGGRSDKAAPDEPRECMVGVAADDVYLVNIQIFSQGGCSLQVFHEGRIDESRNKGYKSFTILVV